MNQSLDDDVEYEAHTELLADIYRANFYSFLKSDILGFRDVVWSTHKSCIQALTAETFRKLIVMPRGSLKSTIACVAFPIWLLLKNPNLRIYIDSEVLTNAKNFMRQIQGVVGSPAFEEVFGVWKPKGRDSVWNQTEMIISPRTKNLKEASITCGGVGTVKVGQHYDVVIGDDYNSPQNSETPEGQEKVIRHYKYNQSILDPPAEWPIGTYVIIGTRYAERDLIGYVAQRELGMKEGELKSGTFDVSDNIEGGGLLL